MLRKFLIVVLALSSVCLVAATKRNPLPDKYNKWITQEVVHIISDEERKEFLKLATDVQRDAFIEQFWVERNPLAGSKQNPYKEEHYKRLAYANETYGRRSNTPGWMTDMGRSYILFGKPTSRAPFTGYGQIYPLELWFYSNTTNSPALPPFFYLLFYIPDDIGEYRYYRPSLDGPMKLVRGSQFHTNRDVYNFLKPLGGDLAHSAFSLIPGEPLDTTDFTTTITSDMLINKIKNFANDAFTVERLNELRRLHARVNSYLLLNQDTVEMASIVLTDPSGQQWLDYALPISSEKFGNVDAGGSQLIVNAGIRLLNDTGDLIVEDHEERAYQAFEGSGADRRFLPFQIANRIPLVPGSYKLELEIVNRKAGKIYKAERKILAPKPEVADLSGPLLASSVQQVNHADATAPFQYFGAQFVPAMDRKFAANEPLRVLYQLQLPAAAAKNCTIEYVVAHQQIREQRHVTVDKADASQFKDGRLLKAKTIPLSGLIDGDYRLVISVRQEGSGQVLTSTNVAFHIDENHPASAIYFLSNTRAGGRAVAAYIRGLESLSQHDREKASDFLRQSVEQNSSNTYASQMLVQFYFNDRKFARVIDLFGLVGLSAFRSRPETLAQLALSFWRTGDSARAKEILRTAQTLFPKDPLLSAAAKDIQTEPARR